MGTPRPLWLAAWPLLIASCLLTAPSDEELVGSCEDDTKNGGETDADCGGPCGPCGTGRTCAAADDCASLVCKLDVCEPPSCGDGVKNGTETDTDCGGPDAQCNFCPVGQHCVTGYDCETDTCVDGVCQEPSCTDNVLNGDEADVDCGISCPMKCGPGQDCFDGLDCASGVCDMNTFTCT